MIRAILACDEKWGIGKNNDLPWPKNSADLKWFKETTINSPVIMGRKTWDSLPFKPLPNRENMVISSKKVNGAHVVVDIDTLLNMAPKIQNAWIIGGATLIESMIGYIDEIHLSRIKGTYDCDTFLPLTKIKTLFILETTRLTPELTIEIWKKR